MAIGYSRKLATGAIPIWQGLTKDIQLAQGGFLLTKGTLANGDVLKGGSPVVFDEAARTATVLHTGVIYENAASNATTYKITKGHSLKVADNLSKTTGGAAYAISAIDTSNAAYDVITVPTTLGTLTAGDLVFASTAAGASASALPAANGLLYEDTVVTDSTSISVVIRGTVYARRIPYNAAIAALAGLDDIIFSQSK